jgi:hypothetical protein
MSNSRSPIRKAARVAGQQANPIFAKSKRSFLQEVMAPASLSLAAALRRRPAFASDRRCPAQTLKAALNE